MPAIFFDGNGSFTNPNSVSYYGAWGKLRAAELLPIDYSPAKSANETAVTDSRGTADIASLLDTYLTTRNQEHAYLHFDKPYYAAGDTMYFKAYVTMGERHELSNVSSILHVDLINTKNKADRSILLKLIDGVAWGDFALPDSLPAGKYIVRAYTKWMQNQGTEAFYEHGIIVGSSQPIKVPESGSVQSASVSKPDAQFFAEAGAPVIGIKTKIAFKAIGVNGLGTDVKGIVTDNTGKTITQFASAHLGMGYFYLSPEVGVNYIAALTFADGSKAEINLPQPVPQGLTLIVNNDSLQKVIINVVANKAYYEQNKDKIYSLVVYSGGRPWMYNCRLDSMIKKIQLEKRGLFTGVNTATLFSPQNAPLCERLFFTQNNDQLNLAVSTNNEKYTVKGKVNIKLNATHPGGTAAKSHLSVSVIDENKVPADEDSERTILSDLLLTADLKGTVEQPGYYFHDVTSDKIENLDLVMLTHGYRGFEWKQVLSNSNAGTIIQPEESLEITGMAQTLKGKPLIKDSVSLMSFNGGPTLIEKTDENGNFKFRNLDFADSVRFMLQIVNVKEKDKTKLVYQPASVLDLSAAFSYVPTTAPVPMVYLKNIAAQHDDYLKYGPPTGIMLKEVKIKEVKSKNTYNSSNLGGPGHADQVIHMADIPPGGQMSDMLAGRLNGVRFFKDKSGFMHSQFGPGSQTRSNDMTLVIDGVVMPPAATGTLDINYFNPVEIETVEVLKYANASIYGLNSGNGVIVLTTRRGVKGLVTSPIAGILPLMPKGYYKARVFYAPKYESAVKVSTRKDFRSTIFWNPELITNANGNVSFDYYNADSPGNYKMVVEGIDEQGNIGREIFRYTVQ